jgi:hypothetical protein
VCTTLELDISRKSRSCVTDAPKPDLINVVSRTVSCPSALRRQAAGFPPEVVRPPPDPP